MSNVTPWMAAIGTAAVAVLVSIPLIGWMIKDRTKRILAILLVTVLGIALGVLIGRTLNRGAAEPEAPEGGQVQR